MKKMFLENLEMKYGRGANQDKLVIDWGNNIGRYIEFIYDDVKGKIKILDYIKEKQTLQIEYNKNKYYVKTNHILKCRMGRIIGKITKEFKIEIGQTFKDDKRDITIIDREYRQSLYNKNTQLKYYKYHCNKCKAELWMEESNLKRGSGCACCSNNIIVKGINDIATTNPEMVKYFVNIEDTYVYSHCSGLKTLIKCPYCGFKKEVEISNLYIQGFSCPKCSDGISYPEKIMCNLLDELLINNKQSGYFITQFTKTNAKWCDKYRYDFYFKKDNEEYIVETHGMQHYKESGFKKVGGRTLEEEQLNDRNKKELAIKNGIKPQNYIVIDCRKSDLEFIKNNIINSRLSEIFDLKEVDWIKIGQNSEKNLVKEVCNYWKLHNDINNEGLTTGDLGKVFNHDCSIIRGWLKKGRELNWCNYKPKRRIKKNENYELGLALEGLRREIKLYQNEKIANIISNANISKELREMLV